MLTLPSSEEQKTRGKYSYKAEKIAFFNNAEYCCRKNVGLLVLGIFSPILAVIHFTERYMSDRSTCARFEKTALNFKKGKSHVWLFVKYFLV